MKIAGIDYSLTSPAICMYESGDLNNFDSYKIMYLTNNKKGLTSIESSCYKNIVGIWNPSFENQQERYEFIADRFIDFIDDNDVDSVYIEDYAFAAHGRVFHIAENCGLLKYKLYQGNIETNLVPPTVIKKFATGKGNSNKNTMYESFVKETEITFGLQQGKDVGNPYSDIVDSYWICRYGIEDKQLHTG